MQYKCNELEYAKKIYEDGFQSNFVRYELVVLAKYLKTLEYSKRETVEFIYKFCEQHIEGFNEVKYYKIIDKAIEDGRKKNNNLIVINSIDIMESELKYIDSLDIDDDYKKILLSFLVNKKISNAIARINYEDKEMSVYFNGTKKKYSEIYKQSKTKRKYDINLVIAELIKKQLIISIKKGDIVLSFIENIPKVDSDNVFLKLTPDNFEDAGFLFDYYKGDKKIKFCSECGKLIKTTNNKTKYCNECGDEKERIRKREWKRKNSVAK